jgi:hypothetical protein
MVSAILRVEAVGGAPAGTDRLGLGRLEIGFLLLESGPSGSRVFWWCMWTGCFGQCGNRMELPGLGLGLRFSCERILVQSKLSAVETLCNLDSFDCSPLDHNSLITSSLLLRRGGAFVSDRDRGLLGVLLPGVRIETRRAVGAVVLRVSSGRHCGLWITAKVAVAVSVSVTGGGAAGFAGGGVIEWDEWELPEPEQVGE